MGLFGPPNIENLKAKGDVQGLIKALGYQKDPNIRQAAAVALGQLGDHNAVEALISTLEDSESQVRLAIVEALGQLGNSHAVEPLITVLTGVDTSLKVVTVQALGEIGNAHAVEALTAAPKDGNIALAAADTLVKIGAPAVEPLITVLTGTDNSLKMVAVKALGEIGNPRAAEALTAALNDGNISLVAADTLVKIGAPAVEPLIAALKDVNGNVRKAAAEVLGKIGARLEDPTFRARAVEALTAALKGGSWYVLEAVARALESLNWHPERDEVGAIYWISLGEWESCVEIGAPAVEPLTAALTGLDSDMRISVVMALGKIDDPRVVKPLMAALKDYGNCSSDGVRKAAMDGLSRIGAPAVEPLIATLKDAIGDTRRSVAEALGQIGVRLEDAALRTRAVEALVAALKDGSWYEREAVAKTLESLDWYPEKNEVGAIYWISSGEWEGCVEIGAPAIEPLIAALKDGTWLAIEAAAEALGRIGDARAIEPLLGTLQDAGKSLSDGVRRATVDALGRIGDAHAVEPLVAALQDNDEQVRNAANSALVQIGVPAVESLVTHWDNTDRGTKTTTDVFIHIGVPAIPTLIEALKSSDKYVRCNAARGLIGIYKGIKLNQAQKSLILKQRELIIGGTDKHTDKQVSYYERSSCDSDHNDYHEDSHEDTGIGIDFPL